MEGGSMPILAGLGSVRKVTEKPKEWEGLLQNGILGT